MVRSTKISNDLSQVVPSPKKWISLKQKNISERSNPLNSLSNKVIQRLQSKDQDYLLTFVGKSQTTKKFPDKRTNPSIIPTVRKNKKSD
jgi:hypothetical protein